MVNMETLRYLLVAVIAVLIMSVNTVPVSVNIKIEAETSCRDEFIWIADGSIECGYLVTSSRAEYFCNTYSLTDCCQTCADLRRKGIIAQGNPVKV